MASNSDGWPAWVVNASYSTFLAMMSHHAADIPTSPDDTTEKLHGCHNQWYTVTKQASLSHQRIHSAAGYPALPYP